MASCEGGSDAVAWFVVAIVVLFWALIVSAPLRAAQGPERALLTSLLIGTAALGAMILFLPDGENYVSLFLISLLVPTLLGTGIGIATGATHPGRALFVSFLGSLSITGGAFLVIFSFITFGSGCLV